MPRFNAFKQLIRPVIVVRAGSAGNSEQLVSAEILAEALIAAIFVRVIFGPHISAAAPVFVAYPEIFQFPRLFSSVFPPKFRHR